MSRIIQENILRNAKLDAFYDPIYGIGSTIERQCVQIKEFSNKIWLPVSMLNVPWVNQLAEIKSTTDFIRKHGMDYEDFAFESDPIAKLEEVFISTRFDHDFEYWATSTIQILDKDAFKQVPFILRGAQRKLLWELETMRLDNVPIRIVLLKARQWGGSTLVQFYIMWLQQRLKENWHAVICAQDDGAAGNVRQMYVNAANNYPEDAGKITLKPYAKSQKNQFCVERNCILGVGSYRNPDQFRSYNYAAVHMTEVGTWEDTPKRSAMSIIGALKETVPDQPYTVVVEESTAKGLNYFYDSWLNATSGKSRYKAVFVAWWEIDRCRIPVKNIENFYNSMSEHERFMWDLGATIEGIAWYRQHKIDKKYTDWKMMEENPSTAEEAFQSSGQKVFAPNYIQALRNDNKEPVFIGEVFADSRVGKEALNNIRFEKVPNGNLKIWKFPESQNLFKHRYVVTVDIGGRTEKADNSIIRVFDRSEMISGGYVEAILTWAGHTDQDLLAWKAVQISKMYDNALLAVEGNSLDKEEEGNHFQTVLDQIKDHYKNLYIRNDVEKVGDGFIPKYGWWTTEKSKGLAINALNASARERMLAETGEDQGYFLVENDKEVCDEMSWFETKTNGSQGAVQGKRDDRVVTTAIGVHIAINEMPLPELKRQEYKRPSTPKIRTQANF